MARMTLECGTATLRGVAVLVAIMALSVAGVGGQVQRTLTLDDAIELAKRNNPTFLSTQNDEPAAAWGVREAYGAFLPTLSVNAGGGYRGTGEVRVGTITLDNQVTDWVFSNYGVNANWRLDGNTVFGPSNARASRRATEASITAAEFNLESTVAAQYMMVLRGQDGVDVAEAQLERARQNVQLVQTRVSTGAAAGTDGTQAEVDVGNAEVALIQAQRDLRQAQLLLSEQIGEPVDEDVTLSSGFDVFEPDFELDALLGVAMGEHPSLEAFRAREDASRAQARATATSQYLPTISVTAGISAYTQQALNEGYVLNGVERTAASRRSSCEFNNVLNNGLVGGLPGYTTQDCTAIVASDADKAAALAGNSLFPFDFTRNPLQVNLTVSLPIFTGFSRERQVSQARNQAEDAEYQRRSEELRLRTQVTNAYDNLQAAYEVVQVQERSRTLADTRLQAEQRRYALGASGVLALMDAQNTLSLAEQAYLNAVYDFHYNLIALEAAVGQPLRTR